MKSMSLRVVTAKTVMGTALGKNSVPIAFPIYNGFSYSTRNLQPMGWYCQLGNLCDCVIS